MNKCFKLVLALILAMSMAACGTEKPQDSTQDINQNVVETEVLVVGAGGAGLAAAAGAGEQGAKVIVLESAGFAGGAAMVSGGHMAMLHEEMNAKAERNDADLQKYLDYKEEDFNEWAPSLTILKQQVTDYLASDAQGRFDSVERMIVDHYVTGKGKDLDGVEVYQNYELVKEGLEANWEIFEWLTKEGGMEIKDSFYKVHANNPVDGGLGLARALTNLAEKAGAEIVLNTTATELIMENDKAVGVKAIDAEGKEVIYRASKGVILATGSFSSNGELCAKYQRIGEGLTANNPSNNVGTNKGAGILMAEAVGAELKDMQFMMTVLRGYNNGCTLSQAGTIKGHQLVVNSDAVRYGDETSGKFNNMTNNQKDAIAYYVGDAKMIAAINEKDATFLEKMKDRGFIFIADTLEEAATAAGLDAETLKATVETFNSYVEAGEDKDFGRKNFAGKVEEGQFIIAKMQMYYHLTYGGLVTDTEARVLDTEGNWINGLYAAGDVTCGFEGAAHQSGDCLSIVVYYGKVAGENAAKAE